MKAGILLLLCFVALLWAVELVNWALDHRLNAYGILPRTQQGAWGIALAPLLHGGASHLASNTLPLLILGGFVALRGARTLALASLVIIVLGGMGVWVAGRSALHVGASGLALGLFGYLVALGWHERSFVAIFAAIAAVALYGGMIFGVLPQGGFVSWESHLFGLLAGVVAGWCVRPWRG